MLINGMSFKQIANKYKISYNALLHAYKVQSSYLYNKNLIEDKLITNEGSNELPSNNDQLYTEESLNQNELLAYYKYENKNKAYYE